MVNIKKVNSLNFFANNRGFTASRPLYSSYGQSTAHLSDLTHWDFQLNCQTLVQSCLLVLLLHYNVSNTFKF